MKITFAGGLNENEGGDINECQTGENFELTLGRSDYQPRKPFDLKGTSTLAGSISGIMQLIMRDDTETTLVFDDDASTPTIYEWDGGSTFTSKRTASLATGSLLRDVYYSLDDVIVMFDINKTTPLLKWDGTTCSRLLTAIYDGNPASVTSITRSGSTATVTTSGSHSLSTGDIVKIAGAVETDYNIEAEVTVTGATTFTYTVAGSPSTPATGTITWDNGTDIYAKYGLVHNGRLWAFNVKAGASDLPHLIAVSAFENIESFDTSARAGDGSFATGAEAFYLLSPDLKPINGVALFNKEIIVSTLEGRLYRLAGYDANTYEWIEYHGGSAAIGTETMANFGNDVIFMREGGNIDTLRATDTSGDVEADDLSRWIPETTKDLSDALTVYDRTNQKVYMFVTNKALVLFKNNLYGSQFSPWGVYTTQMTNSLNAVSARHLRRPGETTYSLYWGDDSGNIYDANGTGAGDSGSTNIRTTRTSHLQETPQFTQFPVYGNVRYRRQGECELGILFNWSDIYNVSTVSVTLKGPSAADAPSYFGGAVYFGGDFYFNEGFEFSENVASRQFSPGGRAESCSIVTELDTTVAFKIDHVEVLP